MNNILSERDTKAVLNILVEQLGVREDQLTPDAKLREDLGADSLTIAEITLALEDHFELSIPDQQWEDVSTVENVFHSLAELLQSRSKPVRGN